jgi:protein-disulfide isomerase
VNRNVLIGAAVAVVVILAAFVGWRVWGGGPVSRAGDITITDQDMTMGDPNAPVKFVEYAAPSCPFCARFNTEVLPILKRDYIDKGKVFYVFRVFAIGQQDIPAEALARCMPKDKYFAFLDLLYRNQEIWDPEYGITNIEAGLISVANAAGMDFDRASACLADTTAVQKRIEAIDNEAVAKFKIQYTPTFIVNGEAKVAGLSKDNIKAFIDRKLAGK